MKTIIKNAQKTVSFRRITMAGKNEDYCNNKSNIYPRTKSKLQKAKDIFTLNSRFDNFFTKLIH